MTNWKDKMKARFAARAGRSTSTAEEGRPAEVAVEERAEPGKLPVAGPPRVVRQLSTKESARVLNLACSAGAFASHAEAYWATCREAKGLPSAEKKDKRHHANLAFWRGIRLQAEEILGDEAPRALWDAVEIGWSTTHGRPFFKRPRKRDVRKRGQK